MTEARGLHIRRLKDSLTEIAALRGGSPDPASAPFKNWWKGVHHALHTLWNPSPYGLQFAQIRFQGFTPRRSQRSGPPPESSEDAWRRAFSEAESVLKRAIEEAELSTSVVSKGRLPVKKGASGGVINIFLSRPTWLADAYQTGQTNFVDLLTTLLLNPRTLGATDYPSRAPLDEVIEIMSECQGAIILGYPQITMTAGSIKGASINGEVLLSTEWNHIEAGLAHAGGLPLLAIHHHGVNRGIFDRGAMNAFLYQVDLTDASWPLRPEIQGALRKWRHECLFGGGAPVVA